jgi:hypothetical protein
MRPSPAKEKPEQLLLEGWISFVAMLCGAASRDALPWAATRFRQR